MTVRREEQKDVLTVRTSRVEILQEQTMVPKLNVGICV